VMLIGKTQGQREGSVRPGYLLGARTREVLYEGRDSRCRGNNLLIGADFLEREVRDEMG
jgi:hypothetical protein